MSSPPNSSAARVTAASTAAVRPAQDVSAQTASEPLKVERNMVLVDVDGRRIARIQQVDTDAGVVTFTYRMQMYQVPIATLSADGDRLKTTLTKQQIGL